MPYFLGLFREIACKRFFLIAVSLLSLRLNQMEQVNPKRMAVFVVCALKSSAEIARYWTVFVERTRAGRKVLLY